MVRVFQGSLPRRKVLQGSLAAVAAAILPRRLGASDTPGAAWAAEGRGGGRQSVPSIPGLAEERYPFSLPPLPYPPDALQAAIDAQTMEIHHGRHHQGYVTNLNRALEGHPDLHGRTLVELVAGWESLPESVRTAVRNHGGGHLNHALFWTSLSPQGGGEPTGPLAQAIRDRFGSFQTFREQFSAAAASVFGSGWGWLVRTPSGRLEIVTTPNQDNPITQGNIPLLGLDVWEHAYYLRYQNRRADYIQAFWNVVNWGDVAQRLG